MDNSSPMKVLWFSPTPSMYGKNTVYHNGGGWVSSLQKILVTSDQIELGIAFEQNDECFKITKEGVVYYPINSNKIFMQKLKIKIGLAEESDALIAKGLEIINDFKPDIIHVFGSENSFGLLSNIVKIPVIIHMQGSLPSCFNARFPPGYNKYDFIKASKLSPYSLYRFFSNDFTIERRAKREKEILKMCNYFMGRTEWDKLICKIYNPNAAYYYCSETLRPDFYNENHLWKYSSNRKISIMSTLSSPLYKGGDLILKTADLLRNELGRDFTWNVYGIWDMNFHQMKLGIKCRDVNVNLMGVSDSHGIKKSLLSSDVYVHPSYIDNSPNSLCEAQILGVPVVATFVGGIPSLINNGENGILVPSNDPYTMAHNIIRLKEDRELAISMSKKGYEVANKRHKPILILEELIKIYNSVLSC